MMATMTATMVLMLSLLAVDLNALDVANLPAPNNIQFLGRGYNIFKGDPHAKTVDPGFESAIFNMEMYTKGLYTSDQRMRVPDGTTVVNSEYCRKTFTATTISQSRTYDTALVSEVTVAAGVAGVPFSASTGFRRLHQDSARTDVLVVESTTRCEVYTAAMQRSRSELPTFTANFQTALESLPASFNANSPDADLFWRFFRNFGTHVATRISFGSRLTVRHEVKSEALDQFQSSAVTLEMAAAANAEAVYLQLGPKIGRMKSEVDKYNSLVVSTEILAVGGLSNLKRLNEDWKDLTLSDDIVPVQYVLEPLDQFVGGGVRQAAIAAALAQYCHVFPEAQCTSSDMSSSQPVCASAEFSDEWLQTPCSLRTPQRWAQIGCEAKYGLAGLRLTRSQRQSQRYLLNTGCMLVHDLDNVVEDVQGQYAEPKRRRPRDDQVYGCGEGEYVTGLHLNRACFGDENLAVRCKRTARPFRRCSWTEPSTGGIAPVPSYTSITCPAGEVVNAIGFMANPDADLSKQRLRVHCCKFDEDCQLHENGPFDESMKPPQEPPLEDPNQ